MRIFEDEISDVFGRLASALLPIPFLCHPISNVGFTVSTILLAVCAVVPIVRGIMIYLHKLTPKTDTGYSKLVSELLALPYAILLISLIGPQAPMTFGLIFSAFLFITTLLVGFLRIKKGKAEAV